MAHPHAQPSLRLNHPREHWRGRSRPGAPHEELQLAAAVLVMTPETQRQARVRCSLDVARERLSPTPYVCISSVPYDRGGGVFPGFSLGLIGPRAPAMSHEIGTKPQRQVESHSAYYVTYNLHVNTTRNYQKPERTPARATVAAYMYSGSQPATRAWPWATATAHALGTVGTQHDHEHGARAGRGKGGGAGGRVGRRAGAARCDRGSGPDFDIMDLLAIGPIPRCSRALEASSGGESRRRG